MKKSIRNIIINFSVFSLVLLGNLFSATQAEAVRCSRCSTRDSCKAVSFYTPDLDCGYGSQPYSDPGTAATSGRPTNSTFCGYVDINATGGNNDSCAQSKTSVIGYLDSYDNNYIYGWACDQSNYAVPIPAVHIYFNTPYEQGGSVGTSTFDGVSNVTNIDRSDVATNCGGYSAHGWKALIPASVRGTPVTVYAYGIDLTGDVAANPLLNLSGRRMTFAPIYSCANRCSNTIGCAETGSYTSWDAACNNPVTTLTYPTNQSCGEKAGGDNTRCAYSCPDRCSNTKGCASTGAYQSYDAACNNPRATLTYTANQSCGAKGQGDDAFCAYTCTDHCSNTVGCARTGNYQSYDAACNNPRTTLSYITDQSCGTKGQGQDSRCIVPSYSVTGKVFVDSNNNGVKDAGETVPPGSVVYANYYNPTVTPIAWTDQTVTVAADGTFTLPVVYSFYNIWYYKPTEYGWFPADIYSQDMYSGAGKMYSGTATGNIINKNFRLVPYPTGLQAACVNGNLSFSWDNNPAFTNSIRVDDSPDSWSGTCTTNPGDTCSTSPVATPFTRAGIVGHTYKWWLHTMIGASFGPYVYGPNITCNPPPTIPVFTVRRYDAPAGSGTGSVSIVSGDPAPYFAWSSTGATSCSLAASPTGSYSHTSDLSLTETQIGTITTSTTFTLTCANSYGQTSATTTVSVGTAPVGYVPFTQNPGIFFTGTNTPDYGITKNLGNLSQYNWLVNNDSGYKNPITISYTKLLGAKTATGTSFPSGCGTSCIPTTTGVYKLSGPVTFSNGTTNIPSGQKVILLIDGDVTINQQITTAQGGIFILAAKGNITVDKSVRSATNDCSATAQLQGIFSAEGKFEVTGYGSTGCNTPPQDQMLIIEGTVITNADMKAGSGDTFVNNRDLCANNLSFPAVTIRQRPDFILNLPDFAKKQNLIYKEVSP